ncbi:extracellular solute-binding protein [Paenibacillus sp. YN15]|uniref:extracellular solute-binding protein n=1 Tax=Paenibacillus sp. YN15 TaxID=1742774 RepID=UPI000DCCB63B|nr:extracellular solute-binding protein [Paenibacillus sp. YN15]RAU99841.1 ABC transporter substrate-binding protein [Paenibacillus sp. YN15]
MKKWKRASACVLALGMSVGALAGCGGADEATGSGGETPDQNKRYTFTMTSEQMAPLEADGELVKYWEDKFNVDFDVWNLDSSKYNDLLNLRFAGGEIPDKMVVKSAVDLQKYADQDLLAEIPLEMLQKNAPIIYKSLINFEPKAFQYTKIDGKIYGIPMVSAENRYHVPIVYRGDWMKNVGVNQAPQTLEELETLMYKFANEDPDKNGKKDTYGLSATGLDMVYGAYGYLPRFWAEKNGKLVYGGIQPETKQALATLAKWYKDGIIDPEFITGENKGGYFSISHAFNGSKIGFTQIGSYYHWKPLLFDGDTASNSYLDLQKANPQAAESLVYGTPVKGPEGKSGVPSTGNLLSGSYVSFGKQLEKEPDKMAKLLQIFDAMNADYESAMTALFGIKGEHWELNAAEVPVMLNGLTNKEISQIGGHTQLNSFQLPEWTTKRTQQRVDWAVERKFDQNVVYDQLRSNLPSNAKYLAELNKIQDEAFISIIVGDKPVDYFDEFVAKWRKSGGEQLEKEAAEWYAAMQK